MPAGHGRCLGPARLLLCCSAAILSTGLHMLAPDTHHGGHTVGSWVWCPVRSAWGGGEVALGTSMGQLCTCVPPPNSFCCCQHECFHASHGRCWLRLGTRRWRSSWQGQGQGRCRAHRGPRAQGPGGWQEGEGPATRRWLRRGPAVVMRTEGLAVGQTWRRRRGAAGMSTWRRTTRAAVGAAARTRRRRVTRRSAASPVSAAGLGGVPAAAGLAVVGKEGRANLVLVSRIGQGVQGCERWAPAGAVWLGV